MTAEEKIKQRIEQIALDKSASPSDWRWIEGYMIEGYKIAMEEYRSQPHQELPGDDGIYDETDNKPDLSFEEVVGFVLGAKWMRSLASPAIASRDARIRELEEENKKLSRSIKFCKASINGALDGLQLDNTSDVIEKSTVIEQLNEELKILTPPKN